MATSDNKRIAKNTIYLYIRTFAVMLVSLYTSRLVLKCLGASDLGIYNLVGGIVSLMAFLQAAQTKSTSRFITYELGSNSSKENLSRIYSICMSIHMIASFVIFIIAETIGLWIINEYTSIPEERMLAANIVYQFSVLTFIVHFLRCPLDSVIIAHENMSVYAYMSIVEVILQLGLVAGLLYYQGDSLILYGGMILVIAFILLFSYLTYKNRVYPQYKFCFIWEKKKSIEILSFSGWTLLGSSTNTLSQQGVSILFNNFVGLIANAALGFATQVNTAVGRFVSSFTTAFNPQIIKLQANQDYAALYPLMNRASKFSFALCYVMTLPLILNMDFILNLWLDDVPEYTVEFCQLILICSTIDATTSVLNTAITATGEIKKYQIGISCSFLLDFIFSLTLLKLHFHPAIVFGSRIITRGLINMLIGLYYSRKLVSFPISLYMKKVVFPIIFTLLITIPICSNIEFAGFIGVLIKVSISIILVLFCTFLIVMDKNERLLISNLVRNKLNRKY